MSLSISEILPIRFYEHFDGLDNMPYHNQLSKQLIRNEWLVDEEIQLQFNIPSGYSVKLLDSGTVVETSADVTPTGWTGSVIHSLAYAPLSVRNYNFSIEFYKESSLKKTLYADCLDVKAKLEGYIKIKYRNTENKNGIVYNIDGGLYEPVVFLKGQMESLGTSGEFEVMDDADGQLVALNTTQKKIFNLESSTLTNYQAVMMSLISGLDRLEIDGNQVLFEKPVDIDNLEYTTSNVVKGEAISYDWNQNIIFEENTITDNLELFAEVELHSSAYLLQVRVNKPIRYSVNDTAYIDNDGTDLRYIEIVAPPYSVIKIYTIIDSSTSFRFTRNNLAKATIYKVSDMSLVSMFKGESNMTHCNIEADTSLVKDFSNFLAYCTVLKEVKGLDSEDAYASAEKIAAHYKSCAALEEVTMFMPDTVTAAKEAFFYMTSLKNARGYYDTSNGDSTWFFLGSANLEYPKYGTFTTDFNGSQKWRHPKDCDLTVEVVDVGDDIYIRSGVDIDAYCYASSNETYSQEPPNTDNLITSGSNLLIGIQISDTASFFRFLRTSATDENNIKKIKINDLRVTSIEDFLIGYSRISIIEVVKALPSILDIESAFYGLSVAPNFFKVENVTNARQVFRGNTSEIIHIETSEELLDASYMFKNAENLTTIYGRLDTTNATDKTEMFINNPSLITPNAGAINSLMSVSGYNFTN